MSARTPVLVRFPPALLQAVDRERGPLNRHAFLIDLIERAVTARAVSDTPERTVPQATPDAGESKTAPSVESRAAVEGGMSAADLQEPPDAEPEGMTLDGTPPVHEGIPEPSEIRESDGQVGPGIIADDESAPFESAAADLGRGLESPIGLASPDLDEPEDLMAALEASLDTRPDPLGEFADPPGYDCADDEELDLPASLTDDAFDIGGLGSGEFE